MAIGNISTDTTPRAAGAMSFDDNIATTAGYATMAAGGLLACAVGTMVAPAPTLGLLTLGGGVVCATKYKDIKQHFSASNVPSVAPDTAVDTDVTVPAGISDKAIPVTAN